jgi:hypothetical protein
VHAPRFSQKSDHLFALNAGESFEKLPDRISGFQMIEQTLYRNTGPRKNRLAAKNFRALRNDAHVERVT